MYTKPETDPAALDGIKLWDEILKAIVSAMPTQLFPLFKEVYGREYPKDTSIVLLGTETSSFQEDRDKPPGSTLMDIALLVAGTDYYHLECQMDNDSEMVIRMFAYDVRFAITHSKILDEGSGEVTLFFPHSLVIYPEENKAIPDHLKCRVVFQDGSEHIYKIPTVKIQTYSLKEIKEKHLILFIPYTILRLRPRLEAGRKQSSTQKEKHSLTQEENHPLAQKGKHPLTQEENYPLAQRGKHPLTQKELTEFVEEVILVLKEELSDGYLTEREYHDYVRLFRFAADRVLAKYPQMRKEVDEMTEPLIKLPSMIVDELRAEIEGQKAEIEDQKVKLADKEAEIEGQKAELADKEAEIAGQKAALKSKDAEIRRLQELILQLSS